VSEREKDSLNRGYPSRMRRLVAVTLAAAPGVLAWACGGQEFLLAIGGDDATAKDVVAEGPLQVDARDDAPDASMRDAADRDGSDATAADASGADALDAPKALDAEASLDVVESDVLDAAEDVPAHCSGAFVCAPSAPTGWAGPFELYAGSNPAPACEPGFSGATLNGNAGLAASPASCDCQCDVAQGLRCGSPPIVFSPTPTVCSTACASALLTPGACTTVDMQTQCHLTVAGAGIAIPAPPISSPGSCAVLAAVGVPPYSWATFARACGASASARADCKGSSACIPAPRAPFLTSVCIEQAGDVACPGTDFTTKYLYYGSVDDTRSCAMCTCGSVTGASCSGKLTQYMSADGGCGTAQTIYDLPLTCSPLQQPADLVLSVAAQNGSCKPSPPLATGSATPATPMTFCCTP
jgi:hypothetical protein